ncbi:unnamed protein product [Rhizophagus irregularis]|nr:unnamed protein product [Rhizophagus irregularis]
MMYTLSFTIKYNMNELNELQNKMVQSISHFLKLVGLVLRSISAVVPAAKAVVGLSLVILRSAAAVTVSTIVTESVKKKPHNTYEKCGMVFVLLVNYFVL